VPARAGLEVALIAVQSIDGCITRHDTASASWASPEDQAHFRREMAGYDAAVFGAGTYRADRRHIRPQLRPGLLRMVMTRSPEALGAEAVPGQLEFTGQPPGQVLAALAARGRRRCALLGGEQIYGAFLAADLVDELVLTLEPLVFGRGRRLVDVPLDLRFRLDDLERLGADTLLLRYRRRPRAGGSPEVRD
jgi:riboflavin biosynthesis pyrimidine reductase